MAIKRIKNSRGITFIELIAVITIIGIIAAIAVPTIGNAVQGAKINADKTTVRTLNNVTTIYKLKNNIFRTDVFAGIEEDENRILALVDNGYLRDEVVPAQKDASFQWEVDYQIWQVFVKGEPIRLSPLGSNFAEISSGMIDSIVKKFEDTNSYGRTWGDWKYTDLGLDSADWQDPIMHMIYIPSGSRLLITPEHGYKFELEDYQGKSKPVYFSWNLIYDTETEKWYSHSINEENEVNIDTLRVVN